MSCAAELEDSHSGQQKVLEALRRNPTLLKQFRPVLEDTLEEKLESMGIKKVSPGTTVWGWGGRGRRKPASHICG